MKKVFTLSFFFLFIQNIFSQNCNLEFGVNNDFDNRRAINNYNLSFCEGIPITLIADAIPNATYQWFFDDKEIADATKSIYAIKNGSGKYTVRAIAGTCTYTRTIIITFTKYLQTFANNEKTQIICEKNGWVDLYGHLFGDENLSYQWQRDKVDIDGAVSISYRANKAGVYTVRMSQGACSTTTSPVEVKTSNLKTNQIIVGDVTYTKDTTLEFCAGIPIRMVTNYGNIDYTDFKVFKDDKPFSFRNGDKISESGKYRIELKKGDCQLVTPTIDVKFGKTLPKFSIGKWIPTAFDECGKKILYFANSNVISASTNSNLVIEWRKDGVKQIEQPIGYLFTATKTGTYTALLKNGECQRESEKFEIKSFNSELVPLRASHFEGKKVETCSGQSLTLNLVLFGKKQFEIYRDGNKIYTTERSIDYKITESGKYYAISKDGDLCTQYSDTLEVIIKGRKTAPITLDNSQCQNGIFNLSVPQEVGLSYSWKKDGKVIPNVNTAKITVKEMGSYSAVINQDFCSVASSEIIIGAKILANPVSCEGQTLQLNTEKNTSYAWTGPNGFTSSLQNPSISKLSAINQGMYFLKVTNDQNCTFKDSIVIKISSAPAFTVQVPEIICLGKSFTITAKTLNNASAFYNFTSPDNAGFGNEGIWTRNNATQQMAGIYKITATDYATKCSTTATTQININSASDCPSITIGDLSTTKLCYNAETDIPFTTSGVFAPNTIFTVNYIDYQGKLIPLATGTKSPIKVRMTSNYRLIITANDRNISSSPSNYLNLTYVNSPYITYTNRSACTGYSVALKVDTSAYYRYDKIQWRLNEKIIEGATSVNYAATQSGAYSVDVTQNGCTTNSNRERVEVIVTIGKLEKPYIFSETSLYACDGFSVDLASGNYPKDASFQWNLEGKPIEKMTTSTLKATKKGGYSLTVKQGTCEVTSDTTQVFIGDIIQNQIVGFSKEGIFYNTSNPINLCKGTLLNLYYDYRPYAYKEYLYYTKYIQDSISRSQGFRVQWQKNGVDVDKADSLAYKVQEEGLYRLKVSQGNCVAYSKPVQVKFTNKIKLQLSNYSNSAYSTDDKNVFACSADSVQLYFYGNNSEQHYSYPTKVFNDNKVVKELSIQNTNFYASTSGNYWVTQTYPIKNSEEVCIATSDTLNVKIGGTKIEALIQNMTSCLDTINVYSYYQGNAKYRWKFNDTYLPRDTTSSIKIYQSGTYQWEVNTKTCQFISKPFTVTMGKLEATLESPYKTVPCYGEVFTLYPQIKSYTYAYDSKTQKQIDPPTFQWKKDGVDFSRVNYLENIPKGTYSLTIKQKNCSVTTNPITIDYIKIPREVSPKDSTFICPNGGFMELASAANSSYNYSWTKDKKVVPNQIKSSIKATETGIYQAQIESGECATMTYPVKVSQKNTPPTALISSTKDNNTGDSTRIKIDLTSSAPWTIKLTNNQTFTAEKTPYEFNVKPTQTTIYELASVKNTCGDGTVSGKVEVKITVLGNEEIEGAKINLFPVPTQSNCQLTVEMALPEKLEWQLFSSNGKLLSKAEKTKIIPFFSQNIDLESLPSGTYLLKIIVGNKIATRKIIKQN